MQKTIIKTIPQLKKGDIVVQHGGRFLVMEDARESQGHRPGHLRTGVGPSDCAVARSECIEGTVPGYFRPGCDWTQQGNQWARVAVEST